VRTKGLVIIVLAVIATTGWYGASQSPPTPATPPTIGLPPPPGVPTPADPGLPTVRSAPRDVEREKLVGSWLVAATTHKHWEKSSMSIAAQSLKLRDEHATVEVSYQLLSAGDGKKLAFDIIMQHWDCVYSFLDSNTLAMKLSQEGRPDIAIILKRADPALETTIPRP
jgi:hypothetical protein